MRRSKKPGKTALRILRVLKDNPEGLDIAEIRALVPGSEGEEHFNRRLRDLYPVYYIERTRAGTRTVYKYIKKWKPEEYIYENITKKQRARILHKAGGRCQMCGRTIDSDGVKLHVDHKIPKKWGGNSDDDNLWVICSDCNEGKKHYFSSFNSELMKAIINNSSVHWRIALLMKSQINEWIECDIIEFVANAKEVQADWKKRLRELRYFGLKIKSGRLKKGNRTVSHYKLTNWKKLPRDLSKAAREYEKTRADKRKT